jgi:penicillin amidase
VKRFKFLFAIFSFTLIIVFVSVILLFKRIGTSSLPQEDGKIVLSGIGASVEIFRDTLGVPYIVAQSDSDAYFALGYVHAQDRLFQMEMYKDFGEGKLSEIFGRKTLPIDELFRTLRFSEMADSIYNFSSSLSKNILRWYCEGINSEISNAKSLPVEFSMLRFNPTVWSPRDCIVVARLMSWELNISWWTKPVFGEIFEKLGPTKASLLIPLFGKNAKSRVENSMAVAKFRDEEFSLDILEGFMNANSNAFRFMGGAMSPDGIGSNNWVISPTKTVTGSTILCNDPHLTFTLPSKWYFVSISSPSLQVLGVTLPGTPGVVIGRNQSISWGMTNVMADDADFYFIHPDSINPDYYWYNGKLLPFEISSDTIKIRGEVPYILTKRMTVQGPVVTDVIPNSYVQSPLHHEIGIHKGCVALRWNAYFPSDETKAVFLLNTASNFREFEDALRYFGTPPQNFVYADVRGNIGYKAAGNIPLRTYPMPFLPQDGTSSKFVWQSFVPFEVLPGSYDPPSAFIATANNMITQENYPYYLTNLYEPSSRIDRITSFISNHDTMDVELCRKLQLDYQSEFMSLLNDKLIAACDSEKYFPKELVYLKNFDGNIGPESTAATILNETFVELLRVIFRPILGDTLFQKYILVSNVPTRILESILKNPMILNQLYSGTDSLSGVSNHVERADSLLNLKLCESLELALDGLRSKLGMKPINWMWGRVHTLELEHPLSNSSFMKKLFDLGPFPRGGNNTTVNNGEFSLNKPYNMLIGPSMRMVVDLSKKGIYFTMPGGECGQLLSPHYSDFLTSYLQGKLTFFPMSLSPHTAVHHLELVRFR